jgi:rhamnogalacturonyl hydrolase YesR
MKTIIRITLALAIVFAFGQKGFCGDAPAAKLSGEISPAAILAAMQKVGDWQLANPATNRQTGWIQAVADVGTMALAGVSGDPKYRDAMVAKGDQFGWKLADYQGRKYHADDQCYGQVCAELYLIYREPRMLAPLRTKFDWILANPSKTKSLDFNQPGGGQELWSWCDALFMAPPAWLRVASATSDDRYLNFAMSNWWKTTDFLYDKEEHLYFRDSTFFDKREANGKKVFWCRGNGWVLAAMPRVLQYLPANHPDRPRLEQIFKEMAAKVVSCQQPDGLWRASLLDPASFPSPESSGSALFTYGLAWGVNQGILDREKFEPAILKAWRALVACVSDDGKLTHVQPAGSKPVAFEAGTNSPYGGGAFLLAGSEVYRMAVLKNATAVIDHPSIPPPGRPSPAAITDFTIKWERAIKIKVTNPAPFARESETIELNRYDTNNNNLFGGVRFYPNLFGAAKGGSIAVMDGVSPRILDSQLYSSGTNTAPDTLVFQVDLGPGETRDYYILDASTLAAIPQPVVKTFARYVPERMDDFAWESDRIAHRTYGQALIKGEGTISSGPDVWIKRQRNLIVDMMYRTKHYHEDNGDEMDDYRVGKSRGCGGVGIWDGKKLYVSSNYRNWKLITTGPVRSIFELTYDEWDAGGRKVSETKRYQIDAGSWFTKAASTFASEDSSPLKIAVGLAERSCGPDGVELIAQDQAEGWMSYWQPEDKPKGSMGVAIVLPKGAVQEFTNDAQDMPDSKIHEQVPQPTHEGAPPIRNLLAVTQAEVGKPFEYYFGACWDRSGDFTNHEQWEGYVRRFAERRDAPLLVTFEAPKLN